MIEFALFTASIGFLLGCAHCGVIILLPAVFALLISVWLFSGAIDLGGWRATFAAIFGTVGLQVGYFAAVLERLGRQNGAANRKSSGFGLSRFM